MPARGEEATMLGSLRELVHHDVIATDGKVGKVEDVLFDDATLAVRYLVVRSGGVLSRRHALIAPRSILSADAAHRGLHLDLTRQRVEDSPELDAEQPVSRQYEALFHRYYGWPYAGASLVTSAPFSLAAPLRPVLASTATAPADGEGGAGVAAAGEPAAGTHTDEALAGDPHLRSLREVTGYHVQGVDGAIGHVDDLLADDQDFSIRYLVIDTRNWFTGKKVLIPPARLRRFSWVGQTAHVDLPRRLIETAPEWQDGRPVDAAVEAAVHAHFERRAEVEAPTS